MHWLFFGKDISNFTYEIENFNELIHTCQTITDMPFEKLQKILAEINFIMKNLKVFFQMIFMKNIIKKIFLEEDCSGTY